MKFNIPPSQPKTRNLRTDEGTEAIITRHGKSEYSPEEIKSFESFLTGYKPKS